MDSLIERLPADSFVSKQIPHYEDIRGLHEWFDRLSFNADLILSGEKGNGKSLALAAYCAQKKLPSVVFDCSEDVRRAQLFGMFVLRGDRTPFVLGPLPTAIEVANEVGQCVLVLEELNSLSPAAQKLVNPLTDFRKRIELPEAQRVFQLKESARLWVCATMNVASYAGVHALNEDLKSRFRIISVGYPDTKAEQKLVASLLEKKDLRIAETVLRKVFTLAKESRQEQFGYALSTRDVVQVAEDIARHGVDRGLWLMSGKFDEAFRATVKKRVTSIFGPVTDLW